MNNLIRGVNYFLAGFGLITKPGVRQFVIIPLLINILIFIGLFFVLRHFMAAFNTWFANFLPAWLHWLDIVLWILFFISFFLLFIFTFVIIANIIAAPFNSFLAEQVEFYLTGKILQPRSLWENIKDIPRIIKRQFLVLGYYLPRAMAIFILFFIPLVQTIAPFIWFLFHAFIMTLTYIDYPTDNHRIPMQDVRAALSQKRWVSLGFGVSVLVATMIPILNFLSVPIAVAGATKLWLEESKSTSL